MKTNPVKGTKDFLPAETRLRDYVRGVIDRLGEYLAVVHTAAGQGVIDSRVGDALVEQKPALVEYQGFCGASYGHGHTFCILGNDIILYIYKVSLAS